MRAERWGRRTFAYELKHRSEGYYVLIEFTAEPTLVAELDRMLTLDDIVLRHKVIRQPDKQSGRALRAEAKRRADRRSQGCAGQSGELSELERMKCRMGTTVTLVGNVTRDPELRFTPNGQATASFGLAVNRRWQNRQTQEWEEATSFFDVVCWREMAENVSETLTRGARVIVTGSARAAQLGDGRR